MNTNEILLAMAEEQRRTNELLSSLIMALADEEDEANAPEFLDQPSSQPSTDPHTLDAK